MIHFASLFGVEPCVPELMRLSQDRRKDVKWKVERAVEKSQTGRTENFAFNLHMEEGRTDAIVCCWIRVAILMEL